VYELETERRLLLA